MANYGFPALAVEWHELDDRNAQAAASGSAMPGDLGMP
jgi:hypothetical protein